MISVSFFEFYWKDKETQQFLVEIEQYYDDFCDSDVLIEWLADEKRLN